MKKINKDSLLEEFLKEAFCIKQGATIIGGQSSESSFDRCTEGDEGCCDADPELPMPRLGTIKNDPDG
ncbi:MAG: hypothetical protein ACFB10_15920 [Salibacteraceae bacterium]